MDPKLTDAAAWQSLIALRDAGVMSLHDLFANAADRTVKNSIDVCDLWVDLSRQHVDDDLLTALADLAAERDVAGFLERTAEGQVVNLSEDRPANHAVQRLPLQDAPVDVAKNRERMTELAMSIRDGAPTGLSDAPVRAVVHLGIGGGHLGPALANEALGHLAHPEISLRFASSFDPEEMTVALDGLDPTTTIVVACSKSFTTVETRNSLETCMAWLSKSGVPALDRVVAVTAEPERARAMGLADKQIFVQPVGVGGRFSLASAVGFSTMVSIGPEAFEEMLAGMHAVDVASLSQPTTKNAAVLMALVDVWNRSLLGRTSTAVVPYVRGLRLLPTHLQQLAMESLGKGVTRDGNSVDVPTGAVVWGATGTQAQHAFFQLLHQGTDVVPVDFIGVARPSPQSDSTKARHSYDLLMANLAAQADALAFGQKAQTELFNGATRELSSEHNFPGDRPSTTILLPELSPSNFGQLISLYENRTIATGALLGINPFDQWGVELGKSLAAKVAVDLQDGAVPKGEPELIRRYRALRDEVELS